MSSNTPIARSTNGTSRARGLGVLLFAAATAFSMNIHAAVPASERAFLLEIYNNMHPEHWFNQSGWNGPEGTECSWFGVSCDPAGEHVIRVEMIDNFIYGPLPVSLSEQTQLKVFNLRANYAYGPIPSLSKLVNLEVFEASNYGDGSFPGSGLTGAIPSLNGLSNLWRFNVQLNLLSGNLPSFGTESELTALQFFVASENQITGGMPTLEGVPALKELYLEYNQLGGPLPEVSGLSNLEIFSVTENNFTGKIPEISGLANLLFFNVVLNDLDQINESFENLPRLEQFSAGFNRLRGEIGALDGAPNLKQFTVFHNELTGTIPDLSQMDQLSEFMVHYNQLSGELPSLQDCASLEYFHAGHNQLTGSIPPISGMTLLQGFGISDNLLTGTLPTLDNLPNLFDFEAAENRLTGEIPVLLGAPRLWEFLVNDNKLTGRIPRIGPLTQLTTIDVSNNRLTGAPPPVVPASIQPINSTNGDRTALCPNYLEPIESPAWDNATGTSPWHQSCTEEPEFIFIDGFEGEL